MFRIDDWTITQISMKEYKKYTRACFKKSLTLDRKYQLYDGRGDKDWLCMRNMNSIKKTLTYNYR
jgi:hypothetical protein